MTQNLRSLRSGGVSKTLRFAFLALVISFLHDVSFGGASGQTRPQHRQRLQSPAASSPVTPVSPSKTSTVDSASPLGKALAECDKVQEEQFVLPGLKGEIKLDRCYRGREHLVCRYDALLAEGKSLVEEFTRIIDEHYQDVSNVEGVCKLSGDGLGKDSMGTAEFSKRFAAARSAYDAHTSCANKVKQSIRDVTLPDLTQAADLLKSMIDTIDADIAKSSGVQEQAAALAVKMEASQKAIGVLQKIHRSICSKAEPTAKNN